MVTTVEIRDRHPDGPLELDLADILDVLSPQAQNLEWFILELEAAGNVPGVHLGELSTQLRSEDGGRAFSWSALLQLANEVDQVINCVIAGCAEGEAQAMRSTESTSHCTLVIEAVDSTFWRVSSKLPDVVEALRSRFRDVVEA